MPLYPVIPLLKISILEYLLEAPEHVVDSYSSVTRVFKSQLYESIFCYRIGVDLNA